MSDEVTLAIGGTRFAGWTEATVSRSLDQIADTFSLSYASNAAALGVKPGDACVVSYGAHPLIAGWVNQIEVSIPSAEEISTSCTGRSKAGDLADCAAVHKTGQWLNQTMITIISDLCRPFGISVTADVQVSADAFKFARFEVDEGERVYDAMERLLRATGVVAISQPDGSIRLLRVTRTAGFRTLQFPVASASSRQLVRVDQDTFSTYRLRNQTMRANAEESPRHAALEAFEIADENVKRYRPFVLGSDTHARVAELKTQATWERNTRAGKSLTLTYTVPGVLAPDRLPWAPPMLLGVDDRVLGINEILLLSAVELKCTNNQLDTQLVLSYPEAYSLLPLPVRQLNKGVSLRG